MANAELLWKTFDEILAHQELWDQYHYIDGKYTPSERWYECGTTQCLAGTRCLMDGLRPEKHSDGWVEGTYFEMGENRARSAAHHAAERFELTIFEKEALFHFYTTDIAAFKERIQEVIDGKWKDACPDDDDD
jgi:hypothetical protein